MQHHRLDALGAAAPTVWSPSDLAHVEAAVDPDASIRLGGRIVTIRGAAVTIADAFRSVEVEATGGWPVAPGDLVVCELARRTGRATAVLLERHAPAAPNAAAPTDDARTLGPALAARARLFEFVREFFARRGFVEVDTPTLVRSPGLDVHLDGFDVVGGVSGAPAYLITSPEYHMKRLLTAGVPRLYQICHCFRRGEVGARHNPEFAMVEWYRAFAGIEEVMRDTEELVRDSLTALGADGVARFEGHAVELTPPFERRTVAELFGAHAADTTRDPSDLAREDEERYFRIWIDRIEPAIARSPVPLFVTDFPASQASLARLRAADPRWCERFELYAAGVELCNGFGELTSPVEQRARFATDLARRRAQGRPSYPIDQRFLAALERGMPPAGGNALGLDRLLMLGLGAESIGQVQPFPVDRL